jgi:hypothetical protein
MDLQHDGSYFDVPSVEIMQHTPRNGRHVAMGQGRRPASTGRGPSEHEGNDRVDYRDFIGRDDCRGRHQRPYTWPMALVSSLGHFAAKSLWRLDLKPYPVCVMLAVLAKCAVRKTRNVDCRAIMNIDQAAAMRAVAFFFRRYAAMPSPAKGSGTPDTALQLSGPPCTPLIVVSAAIRKLPKPG